MNKGITFLESYQSKFNGFQWTVSFNLLLNCDTGGQKYAAFKDFGNSELASDAVI